MKQPLSHHFNEYWFNRLTEQADFQTSGSYNQCDYSARIVFPNHHQLVERHYNLASGCLKDFCRQSQIPFTCQHFGVEIHFHKETELILHDDELKLDEGLRQLIKSCGAVIIKNTHMNGHHRDMGHRNRFPHLNFHVDRTAAQATHYSLYSRNPFDEEQKHPRTSSTLFIPAIVGHLQGLKEGIVKAHDSGMRGTYTLFTEEPMDQLLQNLILEHRWDEPVGTGEISMLNNLNMLHASYYRNPAIRGYKIGVRYLA